MGWFFAIVKILKATVLYLNLVVFLDNPVSNK